MEQVKATVISEKWAHETLAQIKEVLHVKSPSKLKGRKLEPKYKDPVSGKTWAGRGRLPNWIVGGKEQYRI